MIASPKAYTFPFLKREQVAKDAHSFYFQKTPDFTFIPGQYIRMILDHLNPDDRGTTRLFSISASPLAPHIMITTRIIQSTFKHALLLLQEKQPVQFFGPQGKFVYSEEETRPFIFLAGGIGITPFHSILTFAAEKNLTHPMTLFISFTTADDVVFFDELTKIAANNSAIKVVYSVSHPEQSQKPWSGEVGRVSADLIKKYIPEFMNAKFMISGPPPMVEAMQQMAHEMGVPGDQVQIEKFTGY